MSRFSNAPTALDTNNKEHHGCCPIVKQPRIGSATCLCSHVDFAFRMGWAGASGQTASLLEWITELRAAANDLLLETAETAAWERLRAAVNAEAAP